MGNLALRALLSPINRTIIFPEIYIFFCYY